ncbi:MAG TPA: hypothetical protein VMV62_01395 [Candidatus Paceibacterota bacterium]|nr:hypothetical protein [Candidatus Paceibacterota bacterium]
MKIEWNKVTWYSKLAAVIVFLATFLIAFNLGILWEKAAVETALVETPAPSGQACEAGAHCGGFIRNAPTCASGYHCQLQPSRPDTGGTCVKD